MPGAYVMGASSSFTMHVMHHNWKETEYPALSLERFTAAWRHLFRRHDVLRTEFLEGGRAFIHSIAAIKPHITVVDMQEASSEEVYSALALQRAEWAHADLPTCPPYVRTIWNQLPGGRVRLHQYWTGGLLCGASNAMLTRELQAVYDEPARELPPCRISWRDYVLAASAYIRSEAGARVFAWWRERLPAMPAPLSLPTSGKDVRRTAMELRSLPIDSESWQSLLRLSAAHGLFPSTVFNGAVAEVYALFAGSRHFLMSMMINQRFPFHEDAKVHLLGNFADMLPLEIDFRREASFAERLKTLQAHVAECMAHANVSGISVLGALNQQRGTIGQPAIPYVLSWGAAVSFADWRGGELQYEVTETPQTAIDTLILPHSDGGMALTWYYLTDWLMSGLDDAILSVLHGFFLKLAEPDTWSSERPLPLPASLDMTQRLVCATRPLPAGFLHSSLESHAKEQPGSKAVTTPTMSLSYSELADRVRVVALELLRHQVKRGECVATMFKRSAWMPVAAHAILQVGAAYVPIDSELPFLRICAYCEDAGVRVALTLQVHAELWPGTVAALDVVHVWSAREVEPRISAVRDTSPCDLAYVIFTSGTTGKPKGVMLNHSGPLNTCIDVNTTYSIGHADRIFAASSYSFDLSVYDMFGVSLSGAAVVYCAPEKHQDPASWLALLRSAGVTVWNSAPALMQLLIDSMDVEGDSTPLTELRLVMLSGDWIPLRMPHRLRHIAPNATIVSLGGATEASIWSIWFEIGQVDVAWSSIPYGALACA
jgi:pyochelin synthetase